MKSPGQLVGRLKPVTTVPLLMVCLGVVLTLWNPPFLEGYVETLLVDLRFKVRNLFVEPAVPDDIVIVAVDERSLAEYGRWYWPRALQARLIEKILSGDPRVLAIDVFYAERETPDGDSALAAVLNAHRDRVIVGLTLEVEQGKTFEGEFPDALYDSAILRLENVSLLWPIIASQALLAPEPMGPSPSLGHVYSMPDRDGKLRWEPLYVKYGDEFFPSLSLQAARVALGLPLEEVRLSGGEGVKLGGRLIPTDDFGRLHINYLGREGTFPYVSAGDVLSGRQSPDVFRDKIVWLGTSAVGTFDSKITPFSANCPGVETAATAMANLVDGTFIRPCSLTVNLLVVFALGVFVALVCSRLRAMETIGVVVSLSLLLLGGATVVFAMDNVRVNLTVPLGMILTQGAFIISYRYGVEERSRTFLKQTFSTYLAPELIEEMFRRRKLPELGGESRVLTAFFTDIASFSSFSEILTPEQLVELINEYLTAMTDILLEERGTLDKYEGDAIIAFFGAPLFLDDHAMRAVRTAVRMQNRLGELRREWRTATVAPDETRENLKGLPRESWKPGAKWPNRIFETRMRIGINTGPIVVGNVGSRLRMNYTMMGDAVNLAARLESAARFYGVHTLVSESTLESQFADETGEPVTVSSRVVSRFLDRIAVVGREEPVRVYEVLGLKGDVEASRLRWLDRFDEGMQRYLAMEWDRAIEIFRETLEGEVAVPGLTTPSAVYIDRCETLIKRPPEAGTWDGVFRLANK